MDPDPNLDPGHEHLFIILRLPLVVDEGSIARLSILEVELAQAIP